MIAFALISTVLYSAMSAGCADVSQAACDGTTGCTWVPGLCSALEASDCNVDNCVFGCAYGGQAGYCEDTLAMTCGQNPANCESPCYIKNGFCEPTGYSQNCFTVGPSEDWPCSTYSDSYGCEDGYTETTCDLPQDWDYSYPSYCSNYYGTRTICGNYSDYQCKVSYKYDEEFGEYLPSCVPNDEGDSWEDICSYSCQREGGGCYTEEDCGIYCIADGMACRAANDGESTLDEYCAGLSVESMRECDFHPNECKYVTAGDSGGYCTPLSDDEICARLSVVIGPEVQCTTYSNCQVNAAGTACEMKPYPNWPDETNETNESGPMPGRHTFSNQVYDECSWLAIIPKSKCELSDRPKCIIDSESGNCKKRDRPTCRMTADYKHCDPASLNEGCIETTRVAQCVPKNCGMINDEDDCGNINGCEWTLGTACLSPECVPDESGACVNGSPASCTSTPATISCTPINPATSCSLKTNSSGCADVEGCKWRTTGANGVCKEKNCYTHPSYATCCTSAACDYCSASPRPSDCPPSTCSTSYAVCCSSDPTCSYCKGTSPPNDCPPPGTGSYGQSCGNVNDAACRTELSCQNGYCATAGAGEVGQSCGLANDAPCYVGLYCTSGRCTAGGTGAAGQSCADPYDKPCNAGLSCQSGRCAAAGTGAAGQSCGVTNDAPCNSELSCQSGRCATAGKGAVGQSCGVTNDAPCNAGLSCQSRRCAIAGTGAREQPCGEANDVACTAGLSCQSGRCGTAGMGAAGQSCGVTNDAPCNAELSCQRGKCFGGGTTGQSCGNPNDAACTTGMSCQSGKCASAGTGAAGQSCGEFNDAACSSGLTCQSGTCFSEDSAISMGCSLVLMILLSFLLL